MRDNVHPMPSRRRSGPMRPPRYMPAQRDAHRPGDLPSPVIGYLIGIALLLLVCGYFAGLITMMTAQVSQ